MHDLELIKSDSHLFKISWRRIKDSTANCSIIFYKNGLPIPFHGKSDRQTAVLKWIIKEIYCHTDDPLEVNPQQFEVLIRSFRNFILVLSTSFYSVFILIYSHIIHLLPKQKHKIWIQLYPNLTSRYYPDFMKIISSKFSSHSGYHLDKFE